MRARSGRTSSFLIVDQVKTILMSHKVVSKVLREVPLKAEGLPHLFQNFKDLCILMSTPRFGRLTFVQWASRTVSNLYYVLI